jgi:hypothetical protein
MLAGLLEAWPCLPKECFSPKGLFLEYPFPVII